MPAAVQAQQFEDLIRAARDTKFGRDHGFADIRSHADFVRQVPIRDYEGLKPYVEQVLSGAQDVMWPGKPIYFAKLQIHIRHQVHPDYKASIPNHINSARNALLSYA